MGCNSMGRACSVVSARSQCQGCSDWSPQARTYILMRQVRGSGMLVRAVLVDRVIDVPA